MADAFLCLVAHPFAIISNIFSEALPSYANVDTQGKPTTRIDFSVPVEGMEAPWGMAQLTFFADGHIEFHKWVDGSTYNLTSIGQADGSAAHTDINWLKSHLATER